MKARTALSTKPTSPLESPACARMLLLAIHEYYNCRSYAEAASIAGLGARVMKLLVWSGRGQNAIRLTKPLRLYMESKLPYHIVETIREVMLHEEASAPSYWERRVQETRSHSSSEGFKKLLEASQ